MAEEPNAINDAPPKRPGRLLPLILGVVLAAGGAAGGFWAVTQGPLAAGTDQVAAVQDEIEALEPQSAPVEIAFVPLETVVISLGEDEAGRHLIFTAELEVAPDHAVEVTRLTPRVLDIMNSYLRVVSMDELSTPTSLARIRSQLLRRIQIVTGSGRVHDLLVTQFVVN
ncbi:MAG: flagellar basal body-associated FliL family protein [Pseudomonadota bacterium]